MSLYLKNLYITLKKTNSSSEAVVEQFNESLFSVMDLIIFSVHPLLKIYNKLIGRRYFDVEAAPSFSVTLANVCLLPLVLAYFPLHLIARFLISVGYFKLIFPIFVPMHQVYLVWQIFATYFSLKIYYDGSEQHKENLVSQLSSWHEEHSEKVPEWFIRISFKMITKVTGLPIVFLILDQQSKQQQQQDWI